MSKWLMATTIVVTGVLGCGAVQAADADGTKWGAHVDLEGKLGTERSLGEADLFVPLAQNSDSLLFTDIRTRLAEGGSLEGNFGLGVRHMLGDSGWNVGTYGYFDRRRSESGSIFNQVTGGLEALSEDWDLRVNGYRAIGRTVRDLGPSSTVGGGSSAAVVGTSVVVTTAGSTTTTVKERSLSGFDAEAGWRVPLWDAGAEQSLRVYGGYYHFAADNAPTVEGPRGRLDLTFNDVPGLWDGARLSLGAEVQRDDPRGTQGFVSARLRIPLGASAAGEHRLGALARRMTDPVVRDIDIVTSGARSEVTATTPTTVEAATATASGQAFTIIDGGLTGGGDLPAAVAAAGANSLVILSGTFATGAPVEVQSGQTIKGAGTLAVKTPSGVTASVALPGATVDATINTGGSAYASAAFNMAANSTLDGLTISNSRNTNLGTVGVNIATAGVSVVNSTILATEQGATTDAVGIMVTDGGLNAVVRGNSIRAVANGFGLGVGVIDGGGGASATIADNTLNTEGVGGWAVYLNDATINAGSTGNVTTSTPCQGLGVIVGMVYFTDGTHCPL